uniref:NmrA-like domain-containing protein n=2 Tax=Glycine subgen. Soja TaxID=1462606 RepID=K7LSY8_SOYBN
MEKSKILVIGATGNLGYDLAEANLKFCHPTFALVGDSAFSDPIKAQELPFSKVRWKMTEAVRLVDVVICSVSARETLHQKLLIRFIKQVGSIKHHFLKLFELLNLFNNLLLINCVPQRFIHLNLDGYNFYAPKVEISRLVEAEGIPYTFISCNFFMRILLPSLAQPGLDAPPRDKVTIFGDGNTKGVFMKESDVAAFTINAVDDPRNVCSLNELVEMWEIKIGKKLETLHVSEVELLQKIKGIIISSSGVNGTQLYPHLKYTTVSEFLHTLV